MKRLVKLNALGYFTEIDTAKAKRAATELKNYIIEKMPRDKDPYGVWQYMMPLCEAVINGSITEPLNRSDLPLGYPCMEGWLPEDFCSLCAVFKIVVSGTPLSHNRETIEIIGGERYAYMDFED